MGIAAIIKNESKNRFSNRSALILSILIGIPFNALVALDYFYNAESLTPNAISLISMFVFNIFLFYALFSVNLYFIHSKWKLSTKFIILVIGSITISIVLSLFFIKIMFLLINASQAVIYKNTMVTIIRDLVVVVIVQVTVFFIYIVKQEQESAIIHEKLSTENIRVRYEVLKSQVDPHFIFNSLNTLDGLIGEDDDRAHEYLENFSSVFRYVINNKEITNLSDELDFTESFATMMKIRFGENFSIEYHIDEKYKTWFIMPISLQLLVENAIKHNVMSKNHPLLVTIETTPDDSIRVKNKIRLKNEPDKGEGIGLANLTDRYNLLFNKGVSITQSDVFCVEIPLINNLIL